MIVFDLRPPPERLRAIVDSPPAVRFAGAGAPDGLDCAGAVGLVYELLGVPCRTQETYGPLWYRHDPLKMVRWVVSVLGWKPTAEVQPMDLLVLGLYSTADHAGVYAGGGRFIHMGETLSVASLSDRVGRATWSERLFAAYRPGGC